MTNIEIYNVLRAGGMTPAGALGTMANLRAESAMRPNNVEDRCPISDVDYTFKVDNDPAYDFATDNGSFYGYGYAQWTDSKRKRKLLAFARSRGASIADPAMQLDFLLAEMRLDFEDVWKTVTTSDNLLQCTQIVLVVYENPKIKNLDERYRYAQDFEVEISQGAAPAQQISQAPAASAAVQYGDDLTVKLLQLAMAHDGYWAPDEITGIKTPEFRQRFVEYAEDVASC